MIVQGRSIKDLSLFAEEHEIEWLLEKKKNKKQIDSWHLDNPGDEKNLSKYKDFLKLLSG